MQWPPKPTPPRQHRHRNPCAVSIPRSFGILLDQLGISLLVSTYQAGKLVILRADGGIINTHFRAFNMPMGVAYDGERLAIGTAVEIWEYHDVPGRGARTEPAGKHDACSCRGIEPLPATCRCTRWPGSLPGWPQRRKASAARRTVVRQHPLFLSGHPEPPTTASSRLAAALHHALAPQDRCHLNGLTSPTVAVRDVTALGETDDPAGWRGNKKSGGVLLEMPSGRYACGLSMPHSPRWYDGRLWVLDSGSGGSAWPTKRPAELTSRGRVTRFHPRPGFLRPLRLHGPVQVRETAVFSGIAIAERPERPAASGSWTSSLARSLPF